MRILVAATMAIVMLGSARANAQSLEKTYADLCSDPAKAKSESCVALRQALMAKLQAAATSTSAPTLADTRVAPPTTVPPQKTMEQRWGLFLGLVDKKVIDVFVGGNLPYEYPPAIFTFAWDIPGQVLGVSHLQPDGSTTKIATWRWDDVRGGLVETSVPDGVDGLLFVPQADGSYMGYVPSGKTRIIHRKIEHEIIDMRTESDLGNRWELGWHWQRTPFVPESFDLLKKIHANSQNVARGMASMDPKYRDPEYLRMMAEQKAAARAAKAERSAERAAMFGAVVQGVAQGVAEIDTGGYAESQANLNATVANIQHAADVERQQQALAAQQAQARAAEEQRQKHAENARWVAEKEHAAAEYRSGQVNAAAAREAQLVAQQQAEQQRRASAAAASRSAEQAAAAARQQAQSAALAKRPTIAAQPRPISTAATQQESKCSEAPGFRKIIGYAEKTRELAMRSMMETPHLEPLQDVSCTQPPNLGYTLEGWWKCTAMAPTGLMVKHCPQSNSGVSTQ